MIDNTTYAINVQASNGTEFIDTSPDITTTTIIFCEACGVECHKHYFSKPVLNDRGQFQWRILCPKCEAKE